jgi:co-chaperonin GroES (HSP10)
MLLQFPKGDAVENKLVNAADQNVVQDRVLARIIKFSEQNEKGFFLPANSAKEVFCAQVMKIGPKVEACKPVNNGDTLLEVGDIVTFRFSAGLKFNQNGVEYIVLREAEIVSYFKEEALTDYSGPAPLTEDNSAASPLTAQ